MPLVKIELQQGRDKKTVLELRDTVMDAVIEALKVPPDDRNIRLFEYQADLFQMKPPYEVIIEITMFAGRTKETKKRLYQAVTGKLAAAGIIEREKVFIVINEIPAENWGIRGGFPADEIELGFKVNM